MITFENDTKYVILKTNFDLVSILLDISVNEKENRGFQKFRYMNYACDYFFCINKRRNLLKNKIQRELKLNDTK